MNNFWVDDRKNNLDEFLDPILLNQVLFSNPHSTIVGSE